MRATTVAQSISGNYRFSTNTLSLLHFLNLLHTFIHLHFVFKERFRSSKRPSRLWSEPGLIKNSKDRGYKHTHNYTCCYTVLTTEHTGNELAQQSWCNTQRRETEWQDWKEKEGKTQERMGQGLDQTQGECRVIIVW